MGKSIWEVLGFVKSKSTKEKVKVLQDYRVHFSITVKDKPMLGKIEGQATVTSDTSKHAEEYLIKEIWTDLQVNIPWETQAVRTVTKEGK